MSLKTYESEGYKKMADRISSVARSKNMAAVRAKNTTPEIYVRKALFKAGCRYRLHYKTLPGSPDIVLPKFRLVVFVNGCFWHGHKCLRGLNRPASNKAFWNQKLDSNIIRDQRNRKELRRSGWKVRTIWTCSLEQGCRNLLNELAALSAALSD